MGLSGSTAADEVRQQFFGPHQHVFLFAKTAFPCQSHLFRLGAVQLLHHFGRGRIRMVRDFRRCDRPSKTRSSIVASTRLGRLGHARRRHEPRADVQAPQSAAHRIQKMIFLEDREGLLELIHGYAPPRVGREVRIAARMVPLFCFSFSQSLACFSSRADSSVSFQTNWTMKS